jgi:hypothetical protein
MLVRVFSGVSQAAQKPRRDHASLPVRAQPDPPTAIELLNKLSPEHRYGLDGLSHDDDNPCAHQQSPVNDFDLAQPANRLFQDGPPALAVSSPEPSLSAG